ncbi:MAG: nitrate/nitrite transporter NrtS [Caulobacter sp.]
MMNWKQALSLATSNGVPRRAIVVAVVVGSALNLINQGDALFGPKSVDVGKLLLTFIVPYLVSTHGAVSARMSKESQP